MKFTLINPISNEPTQPELYMSTLYLATALDRAGYKVKVIDCQLNPPNISKIAKNSDCVGFSVMTSQVKHALYLSDKLKEADRDLPIVWGGIHPTLFPKQTASDASIDYVMREESETGMIHLMEHLKGKRTVSNVDNLTYCKKGTMHSNPIGPPTNLNELSPPSWHLLDMKRYIRDYRLGGESFGRSLPVHSSRGCPHNCTFCINTIFTHKQWRPLSAPNIVNEIRLLKDKYRIRFIKFIDENFYLDKHRIYDLCNLLIKENMDVTWRAATRANYFNPNHTNSSLLALSKKAGCKIMSFGIESGSERVLREILSKGITVNDALRSVKACRRFDFMAVCSFMIGLPGETSQEREQTMDLIKQMKSIHPRLVIIGPQLFRPYPGCHLYNRIKSMLKEPGSLREWSRTNITGGYFSSGMLPWIKNPAHLANMLFYITLSQSSTMGYAKLLKTPFKSLAALRVKYNLYSMPIEKKVYSLGKSFCYSMGKG